MFFKRISYLVATSALLITLASCGGNKITYDENNFNPTGDKIVKEKITIKMFAPLHTLHVSGGYNNMRLFKEMEEITNIHVEWIYGPVQSYSEKRATTWQSKNRPDAFFLWNPIEEVAKYGANGTIREIAELIDLYAPNYKQILADNENYRKIASFDEGKMYSTLTINDVPRDQTFKQFINKTWLENLNLPIPTSVEQYYDVLKAFKEQDPNGNGIPDEIPLSSAKLYQTRNFLMSAFGYVSTGLEIVNNDVIFVPSTDNYKAYLEYAARLYKEGLLDNNTYNLDDRGLAAKGANVGSFDGAAAYLIVGEENDDNYVALSPLTSSINNQKMWLGFNTISPSGLIILSSSPYYKEIIRWVDFLYSPLGIELQAFGKEGVDWTYDDESKESFTFLVPDGVNIEQHRGTITPSVGLGAIAYWNKDFVLKENNEFTRRINENVENANYMDYLKIPVPDLLFTSEETSRLAIIKTDLDIYMQVFEEKIVTNKVALTTNEWNKHLNSLNQLKVNELISIYQNAYQRYLEK